MNLNFDTATLVKAEAQAIIAFLNSMFPGSGSAQVETSAGSAATLQVVSAIVPSSASVPSAPSDPLSNAQSDAPSEQPARRGRRSKAEILADEAAAKAQAALAAGVPVTEVQPDPTPASTPALTVDAGTPASTPSNGATNTTAKPMTKEDLTALLNGHIQRHSFEAAVAVLASFKCNRVSEALALDPVKLSELAEQLNG